MLKITLKVEGMACLMCEAHMNDAVRQRMRVKRVTSSHKTGEVTILTESDVSDGVLSGIVTAVGYTLNGITREPYEKKGFFSFFKRNFTV